MSQEAIIKQQAEKIERLMRVTSRVFSTVVRLESDMHITKEHLSNATKFSLPKGAANEAHRVEQLLNSICSDIDYLREVLQEPC